MKYKSKNYHSTTDTFVEEVVIPELDKEELRQPQINQDIGINELLVKLCNQIELVIKEGEQNTIIDYYQQLVYQLDLDEPLELNKEAEDKINNVIKLFIEYTKKALINISIVVALQERITNVIKHCYHYSSLEHSLDSLFDSIAYLKQKNLTFTENTAQKRDLPLGVDPSKILEIIDSRSKALKHSKDNLNALKRVLKIDSNISKYTYQLCYEMLYDLEDNTLKVKKNPEAPSLFTSRLNSCWSILKLLASTNKDKDKDKDKDVQSLARNLLVKAGRIIDINREGLNPKNPTSKSYQYSLSDLDRLVTNNTRLLVESHELPIHTHTFTWRERWNKLREIRREAFNLNPIEQQRYLSEEINKLVREIIEESEELLGTPPCDYAVLSFGSLSRKEFFPGSDLECLVVLDRERKEATLADKLYYRSIEQYFTTLFKLVDAQIRCLGEYKEGFGLDESNPATEYDTFVITLDSLESTYLKERKNTQVDGCHYSLVRPALLYNSNSDNNIFKKYEAIISQILSSIHKGQAIDQLSAHVSKFLKMSKEKLNFISLDVDEINLLNKSINLKESYYSPLVHLATDLGLYYNIQSNNTLEIYEELNNKGVIPDKFFNSLKEAYTYIVELRIEAHNFKKAHYDEVYLPNSNKSGHLVLEEEAFEKLRRINIEVITPLYKAIEVIVKDKLNSGRTKASIDQTKATDIDIIAATCYKAYCKDKEALDNPSILAELISIYSRHYSWQYILNDITLPLPLKTSELNDAVIVEGEIGVKRILRPEIAAKLIKEDGTFKETKHEFGRRNVIGIEHNGYALHFKENPELPGMEYAIGSLIRKVTGQGAPLTSLLRFSVGNKVYPVQVSRTVKGINYQTALNEEQEYLSKISSKSFGLMCIASLLINPGDGKPDNYILEPQQGTEGEDQYNIVCIDNDHGLLPALVREKGHTKVMVKSILYCMRQMHENLDKEVREQILSVNFSDLLGGWVDELKIKDAEYASLFTVKEQARLLSQGETEGLMSLFKKYEKEGPSPVVIPIIIRQGTISRLYQKFHQLKSILEHNEEITPMQLLYIIEPSLAKYYDDSRLRGLGAKEMFLTLFKDQYSTVMAGRLGTMMNSRQVLQSVLQEVPNLEDLVLKKHTPTQAVDELTTIKLQSTTLNKVRGELIAGNDKPFKELKLDIFRERVINGIRGEGKGVDFAELDERKQLFILQAIKGASFTELYLGGCSALTDVLLESILRSSPGLYVLNVSGCTNLSSSAVRSIASNCPLIEKLIISNIPKLAYIGTATGLGSLTFNNLRRLDLSNNISLNDLRIKAPKLEWLDLSNCEQITDNMLSALISKCLSINVLKLEGCRNITNADIKIMHPLLAVMRTKLLSKDISRKEIKIISRLLMKSTTLTSLALRGNKIGAEGCKAIGEGLKVNTTLTSLDLWGNKIGAEGCKAIGEGLKANTTLTSLNLGSNEIGAEGCKAIVEGLKVNTTLTSLNLGDNEIGAEGCKAIVEGLKANTTLTSLDLGYNEIGAEGWKAIGEGLKVNTTLTSLDLQWNYIGAEGCKAIGEGLRVNSTLTSLDLRNNKIGAELLGIIKGYLVRNKLFHNDPTLITMKGSGWRKIGAEGWKAIGEGLKVNTTLTSLDLGYNEIGAEGGKAIGEGLKVNTTLTSLDLGSNKIGAEGGRAIGEGLRVNSTLTSLNLKFNNIGDEGCKAIGEGLKVNTTLTSLDLGCNNIGAEGCKAIVEGLKVNSTLTSLDLERNNIDYNILTEINRCLERNKTDKEAMKKPTLQTDLKKQVELHKEQIEGGHIPTIIPEVETKIIVTNTPPQLRTRTNAEKRRATVVSRAEIASICENSTPDVTKTFLETNIEKTKPEYEAHHQGSNKPELVKNTSPSWSYVGREDIEIEDIVGANRADSPQQLRPLPHIGTAQSIRKSLNVERRSTLLEYNAPNSSSLQNKPELIAAAKEDKVITIISLLNNGANPSYTDEEQGRNALHYATELGHKRIIELLLNNTTPVEVNSQDNNGQTALHLASIGGHKEVVEILLSAGTDRGIRDNSGKIASDYTNSFEVKMLLEIKAEKIAIGI